MHNYLEGGKQIMDNSIKEEIGNLVDRVLDDYKGGKNIDAADILGKPDRNEVIDIINNLFIVVYPGYFRDRTYKSYNRENGIAVLIEDIFYRLNKQICLALDFCKMRGTMTEDDREKESYRITYEFFNRLPKIREYLETDLLATYDGDPAAGSFEEIILAYPGLIAITVYRLAHELYLLNVPVIPRLMTEFAHSKTGIDIHPGATIGKSFFIDHGTGVVIGETTVIGRNVKLYQGVTLGALSFPKDEKTGMLMKGHKRHPNVEDNVVIYAGATILGGDTTIGHDSEIGGNVWLMDSIPPFSRVYNQTPFPRIKTKV